MRYRRDLSSLAQALDVRSSSPTWTTAAELPNSKRGSRVSRLRPCSRDNAPMESVNGTLKVECVHDMHFATREQARQAIVEYIGYYNTERRHSSLGNIAPAEFERRWRAESNARAKASRQ